MKKLYGYANNEFIEISVEQKVNNEVFYNSII
jgi:hypothetical protein